LKRTTSDPILERVKYRSKLEERIAKQLQQSGVEFSYEELKIKYEVPARQARYTPDFQFGTIVCEVKGYFRNAAERQKLLLVKEQYPHLDIRLVFQNASKPLYKGSKTTYAQWANDNGFRWADKGVIPESWLHETSPKKSRSQNS
jgi:hypothetical protein